MEIFVEIGGSPFHDGPARIHCREYGAGFPLVFLHSGWGYEIYSFERQIEALGGRYRILIPDRSGYGRSPRVKALPVDFHRKAAVETLCVLDALGIRRAALWGHSDGAVIAAWMALDAPHRVAGAIFEAFHYTGAKTGSVEFFRSVIEDPARVGRRTAEALARDHGADWPDVLRRHAEVWLAITEAAPADLYGGRLDELAVPALFLAGLDDPRAEPGDLAAVRRAVPRATVRIIEGGGHSPHSESGFAEECARIGGEFLDTVALPPEASGS